MAESASQQHTVKMKDYYGSSVSEKWGDDYETRRWKNTPYFRHQYKVTKSTLDRELRDATWADCLELGPGPGTWTQLLLDKIPSARYTLVDISPYMEKQFREHFSDRDNISYVVSDFESFSPPKEGYDLFFSIRAIDYLSDKESAVKKICESLRPDGQGIIIAKTAHPWKKKLRGQTTPWHHQHKVGSEELVSFIESNGCEVIRSRVVVVHIPILGRALWVNTLAWHVLSRVSLGWWNRWLSESYVVSFKKP